MLKPMRKVSLKPMAEVWPGWVCRGVGWRLWSVGCGFSCPRVSRADSRYWVFVWRGVQATHGRVVSRADHTPGLLVRVSRADSRYWVFVWRGVQATHGRVVSRADHTPGLLLRVSRADSRVWVFVWRGVQATLGRVVSNLR